ncbi:MAG: preprotein translocase subunit SecY, partial [Firmicutes bacterium HGW-Firmicutes-13]
MLEAVRSAWKIKELRGKIIFTLLMFVVFRLGSHVPVPGIDVAQLQDFFREDSLFGFLNVIGGGALKNFTIFAMSITPYINASIIMQLLTVVIPRLEELAKEGEEGRKVLNRYIRYATIVLAFLQAVAMTFGLIRGAVINPTALSYITIITALTAGTAFLMWLGEQITEKGIGNGISLIIFAGIIASFPEGAALLFERVRVGQANIFGLLGLTLFSLSLIIFIIAITEGERRIPVQYSKRVVGRRMYGGQSTHIPLKVNQ